MLRLTSVRKQPTLTILASMAFATLATPVLAQSGTKATEIVTPVPPTTPAVETEEEGGWLFRSSLFNIRKPEVTPPAVEWNQQAAGEAAADGQSRLMKPIKRFQDAMAKSRSAWNDTIEKMKIRREDNSASLLSRWFGGEDAATAPPATASATPSVTTPSDPTPGLALQPGGTSTR